MKHCAELAVSLNEILIYTADESRKIVKKGGVGSEPEAIAA